MPEREDAYDPTSVEVERNIQQGGGVGARDLARQAEPSEAVTEDAGDEDQDAPTEGLGRAHPHA